MKIATVKDNGQSFCIRRLNISYLADIKSGGIMWLAAMVFFCGLHLLSILFNAWQRKIGSLPPNTFLPGADLLIMAMLSAIAVALYLAPSFVGLSSPQLFCFDRDQNTFFVNGRKVSTLDKITVHLQDSFGPSRRAFRIAVIAWDRDYIIAQTQRITAATLAGKEFSYIVTDESRQPKYRFHRWADYAGAKTGFSSEWTDYQEIFALYAELTKFIAALQVKSSI